MRWKRPSIIMIRETRVVRKFLWIPLHLDDEVRWFEFANILQQRREYAKVLDCGTVVPEPYWENTHWRNK